MLLRLGNRLLRYKARLLTAYGNNAVIPSSSEFNSDEFNNDEFLVD